MKNSRSLTILASAILAAQAGLTHAANPIQIDMSQPQSIGGQVLADQNRILIQRGGEYRLRGQQSQGQVWINTGDEKVTLILDGLSLTNESGSAIYVEAAGDVDIELAPNSNNYLADGEHGDFAETEAQQNAPLYSKADLKITGAANAKLVVEGFYKDGIVSKDDLDIRRADITIRSKDDGLYGKDSVDVRDSVLVIDAGDDAIKADNAERDDKGFVYLENSNIEISAKDDGIKGVRQIDIMSGKIRILNSYEGIESRYINIHGGDIFVHAEDDAVNISDGTANDKEGFGERIKGFFSRENGEQRPPRDGQPPMGGERGQPGAMAGDMGDRPERGSGPFGGGGGRGGDKAIDGMVTITGGRIHIQSGGDGFDSNGSAAMSGGELFIEGPTSGRDGYIDVDGSFNLTGGTLFAMGSAGMAQTPSDTSTQPIIQINTDTTYAEGATLTLTDANGQTVLSQVMPMPFQSVTLSNKDLQQGATYTIAINGQTLTDVTLTDIITRYGNAGRGGKGGKGDERKGWW